MPNRNEVKAPKKSGETRERILNAALQLFRERGFEAATMREIAERSGMATGAAYYYFPSKDSIVLAFYERASKEMAPLLEEALAMGTDLRDRLRRAVEVKLNYFEPSRALLAALAARVDPAHPLSPFGQETSKIRDRDIAVFAQVISGSGQKVAKDLEGTLPGILWMYQMGLILFWIHDRSSGQKRTAQLIDKSLAIVVGLIRLSSLPLMRPLRKQILDLCEIVAG
jgi:AcrR family transcriptional regulator